MTSSSPQRVPARRRLVPSVVLVTVAALVTGAFALADSAPTPTAGGDVVKYLPPEGFVGWGLETGGEGAPRHIVEHSRTTGVTEVLDLPSLQAGVVLELLGESVRTTPFWRETMHILDGDDSRILTDLYLLSDAGVSLVAGHGGDLGWVYDPPMVQLPADVAPGVEWGGRGSAAPLGLVRYVQDARAVSPSDAHLVETARSIGLALEQCIQVESVVLLSDDTGAELVEITQRELWCEGRGRVGAVAEYAGEVTRYASVAPHVPVEGVDTTARGPAWPDVGSWSVRDVALARVDPFFGEAERTVSLLDAPRVSSSGTVVAPHASTDDLVAFRVDGDRLVEHWHAHPGGTIVTLGTVGEVTIVSTSLRELVAYDSRGVRLWRASVAELVLAPPTPAGGGRAVVAGLDGTVSMLDASTGAVDWSTPLASDIDLAAVISEGRVATIDRAGTITALDADTGEVLWSRSAQPSAILRAFDGIILAVGDDGWMRAFRADTGDRAHAWRYQGATRALLRVGSATVLATDEHMVAVDLESGLELWRRGPAAAAVGDGESLVALRGTEAVVLDERGEQVARWEVPASFVWANQHLVAAPDRVFILHSGASATMVGPR